MDLTLFPKLSEDLISAANGDATFRPLAACTIGLTSSLVSVTDATTLADMNAASATFTGYAPEVLTFNGPTLSESGQIESVSDQVLFQPTDTVTVNECPQAYVWNKSGLVGVGNFDGGALPMGSPLNTIRINLRWVPTTTMGSDVLS